MFVGIKKYIGNPIVIFLVFILVAIIAFGNLYKTFFQQDEWQYFGSNIFALLSDNSLLNIILPLRGQLTHFFPLATIFFLLEYKIFHVNFAPYAHVALGLHILNGFLLFILIRKVIKNKLIAFSSATLFLVNSFSHQAVTWIAAGIGTLQSSAFLIISLMFFVDYIEKKKIKYLSISLLSLLVSILFKEISLFLFIFFGAVIFIIFRNSLRKNLLFIKNSYLLIFITGGIYLMMRIFLFLFSFVRSAQPEAGDVSAASIWVYVYRLFSVPLKGIAQTFVSQTQLISISDTVIFLAYPQFQGVDRVANPYISQSIVFDLVCMMAFFSLLIFGYFIINFFQKKGEPSLANILFLSFLFLIISFFPYIFVPGKAGYFSIFEPRNLYIASMVTGAVISIVLWGLLKVFFKPSLVTVLFLFPFMLLLAYHVSVTRFDIKGLEHIGKTRMSLLNTIKSHYPKLPDNVIVYTVSSKAYYGMPIEEKTLPVQSGFGRMLLVWYQSSEQFPACFYENLFLHGLREQGYKKCENRGFGYFRDYAKLVDAIQTYGVPINNVIAFSWNGQEESFTNITKSIREELLLENK